MQGGKDVHGFVSAFTGSHYYIMDYLAEEVLSLQTEKVRSFLLQTSIIDRMCAPLCNAVVEVDLPEGIDGQAYAGNPGTDELVPYPAGRRTALVPLPPPFRGRSQQAPGTTVSASTSQSAPPGVPVVRAERVDLMMPSTMP